jgi:hypothetical protein
VPSSQYSRTRFVSAIGGSLLLAVLLASGCRQVRLPPQPPTPLTYPGAILPAPLLKVRSGPSNTYPDPLRTPGALNADITQETIGTTICSADWHGVNPWTHKDEQGTASIRPPSTYTMALKKYQINVLGLSGKTSDYEEDHLISLELGGNPVDIENLWPEAYAPTPGAHEKDRVENWLHNQVCRGHDDAARGTGGDSD